MDVLKMVNRLRLGRSGLYNLISSNLIVRILRIKKKIRSRRIGKVMNFWYLNLGVRIAPSKINILLN